MSPFVGTDTYAIDHKGRISIPPSLRAVGPGRRPLTTFYLNMGFDGCVAIYSPDEWTRMMTRLRRVSMTNLRARNFRRAFMQDARQVTVDAQGRIPIPPALIRRAVLGKEAVLHGAEDHIEIWNPDRYQAQLATVTEVAGEYERLAQEFMEDEEK